MDLNANSKLHLAEPTECPATVLERMTQLKVRHMPVVENGDLVGILSDRDLLLNAWSGQRHTFPDDLTVRDVMTKKVATAVYGTPVAELAAMLLDLKVDALPLTGAEGKLVGIVTTTDVIRLVADRHDELGHIQHSAEFMNQFRWDLPEII